MLSRKHWKCWYCKHETSESFDVCDGCGQYRMDSDPRWEFERWFPGEPQLLYIKDVKKRLGEDSAC